LRAWRVTVGLAFRAWPAGVIGRAVLTIVLDVCRGLLPGLALRAILGGGGPAWMAVLIVSTLLPLATRFLWDWFQRGLMYRTNQAATQAVMAAALAPPGIEHLESARYADAMEVVRSNSRAPGLLVDWLAGAVGGIVAVGASVIVLAGVHPLLAAPVLGAGALGVFHAATRRRALAYINQSVPGQRLAGRLAELATSPEAAKEVRSLGLGPWLVGRYRQEAAAVARRMLEGERGPVAAAAAGALAQAVLLALGTLWLVRLAATGRATAGDLALGIVVLRSAIDNAGAIGTNLGADLARDTHVAARYLWLLDYQPALVVPADPRRVPSRLQVGIRLEGVSFRYVGTARPALDDVSLTLPAGSTVALVGDNGAGKSTLVKLLCRFYDPDTGRLTVDGVDLRHVDLEGWRAAATGSFQDFVRFRFLAREAVGVGDLQAAGNEVRVAEAATAGGAAPFLERLPSGYATQLGRDFPDGADLSEGQWQKVALSRAVMRTGPLLVVLDEPTAALDPRSEHALFERYAHEAVAARQRGGITVLVSHRFSTVRMADLIVVLDRGRVVEAGTHAELVAAGRTYAQLYRLQAARYT
ncbi:MAG: ABC transporter ATP-binding protein, partial [Acidimicrobiales bacterium]